MACDTTHFNLAVGNHFTVLLRESAAVLPKFAFSVDSALMPTRKMIKALIAIGITTVLLLSASSFKLYYVRDDSGGQLLWNADEGYLFMSVARRTFKFSYLEYPWIAFKEWVNVPPIPKDERVFLTVIRVTQSGIERHVGKAVGSTGSIPDLFTPIGGTIYANCQGTLCKWAGDYFENATEQEKKELDGINHLVSDIDTQINGWWKRGIGAVAGDSQFSVEIGKDLNLVVKQGNVYKSATDSAIVELHRTGQPPQQLWRVNGEPRKVSKREYEQALSGVESS